MKLTIASKPNYVTVAINKYQLSIDRISYWFTMYNFAIVGTLVSVVLLNGINNLQWMPNQ